MKLFSVIICTYQRYDLLPQAINSVLQQDIGADLYDIWVMDNSPPSPERLASSNAYKNTANLHYIELDSPGLSKARNRASELSSSDILVFLDDDATVSSDWLRNYRDAFASLGSDAAVIGGPVTPAFEIPKPVWLHDELLGYLSIFRWHDHIAELPEGHHPVGANMAIRRDLAVRYGGFGNNLGRKGDEANNLLSGEETHLFNQILEHGGKIYYAPLPRAIHHIPASRLTRSWFRRRVTWQAISEQMQKGLTPEKALTLWPHIFEYLKKVPRDHIPFMGLLWDTDDPAIFLQQIRCTQIWTHILISQGCYPPEIG